jgi:prefoldin subunit 5
MKTANSLATPLVVLLIILCVVNTSVSFMFYKIRQDERMKIRMLENQVSILEQSLDPIKKSFLNLRTKIENTIIQSIQRFDDTLREIEGAPVAIPLKVDEVDKKIQVLINEIDNLNKKITTNSQNVNN